MLSILKKVVIYGKYSTEWLFTTMEVYSPLFVWYYPYPVCTIGKMVQSGHGYFLRSRFNGPRTELQDDGERTYSLLKTLFDWPLSHSWSLVHIYFPNWLLTPDDVNGLGMDEGFNSVFSMSVADVSGTSTISFGRVSPRDYHRVYMKSEHTGANHDAIRILCLRLGP